MIRRLSISAALTTLALALAPAASADAAAGISPAHGFVPHRLVLKREGAPERAVRLPDGVGVHEAAAAMRERAGVEYAAPDYLATASALPDDPGPLAAASGRPGGWAALQWGFLPWEGTPTAELPVSPGGADVVGAWRHVAEAGRGGGRGVVVAVLDTGVAYRGLGRDFLRSPDFTADQFVPGYDFVDHDRVPLDENGHGTHVAGTIAEKTDNGVGLTGIAYNAKLMPVRVLDRNGSGRADAIARGIRFAVAHGADVINMSFNFGCGKSVPGIDRALRFAYRHGVVAVASIGNLGSETCVSPPATGPRTIGVGGSTEGGCLGAYSLLPGKGVDLLAPGGGPPIPGCPSVSSRPIFQVTLKAGHPRRFGEPGSYIGTSMAAAHVSGVAALVLASGVVPKDASPESRVNRVRRRLRQTARHLGLPARQEGAGLIDAGAATELP